MGKICKTSDKLVWHGLALAGRGKPEAWMSSDGGRVSRSEPVGGVGFFFGGDWLGRRPEGRLHSSGDWKMKTVVSREAGYGLSLPCPPSLPPTKKARHDDEQAHEIRHV